MLSDRGCLLRPARAKIRCKSEPSEEHKTSVAGSTVQFSMEQSLGSGHSPMPAPAGLGEGPCSSFLGTDLQCQARTFPVGCGEQRTRPFKDSRLPPRFPQSTSSTFNLHPQDRNQPSLHMIAEARPLSEVPQGTHHTPRDEGRSWGRDHRTPALSQWTSSLVPWGSGQWIHGSHSVALSKFPSHYGQMLWKAAEWCRERGRLDACNGGERCKS